MPAGGGAYDTRRFLQEARGLVRGRRADANETAARRIKPLRKRSGAAPATGREWYRSSAGTPG
jgi:hypothetical protein